MSKTCSYVYLLKSQKHKAGDICGQKLKYDDTGDIYCSVHKFDVAKRERRAAERKKCTEEKRNQCKKEIEEKLLQCKKEFGEDIVIDKIVTKKNEFIQLTNSP